MRKILFAIMMLASAAFADVTFAGSAFAGLMFGGLTFAGLTSAGAALVGLTSAGVAFAQPPGAAAQAKSPKDAAPVDLTGYWVSIVTEDWRWRMVTPSRGDFASIPLNPEGRKVGETWDPAKDEAAGQQCKSYGAPALMRIPGRIHITWQDDHTLRIDTDAGTQTRLFHFAAPPPAGAPASLQGYSVANWERNGRPIATLNVGGIPGPPPPVTTGRSLEVTTTHLLAGYLRKNGPPFSAGTQLNEYYDYHKEPNGAEWITITTVVQDPTYLTTNFVTTTDFRKQPDASNWNPTACSAR